jgi:hypothetical protein
MLPKGMIMMNWVELACHTMVLAITLAAKILRMQVALSCASQAEIDLLAAIILEVPQYLQQCKRWPTFRAGKRACSSIAQVPRTYPRCPCRTHYNVSVDCVGRAEMLQRQS